MLFFADIEYHTHIGEVDIGEDEHDHTDPETECGDQFPDIEYLIPFIHCQRHIAKVQQAIAYQQYPVDKIREGGIAFKEIEDIDPAIPVKGKSCMHSNEISDQEVKDVGDEVHGARFW